MPTDPGAEPATRDELDDIAGPPPAPPTTGDAPSPAPAAGFAPTARSTPLDPGGEPGLRLVRATDLTGLPVVTLGGDRELEVKDVVFDKAAGGITGFTLRKPGLLGGPQKRVLPISGVVAVGKDAVIISDDDVFVPQEALAASGDDVIGDRVLSDDGTDLGRVVDVITSVEGGAADIVGFEVEASEALATDGQRIYLPLPAAMAISGEAVVVPAAVKDYVSHDFTGFGGSVAAYRRQAGSQ